MSIRTRCKYAAWGVDYLKYDWCNTTTQDAQAAYALMRNALNATGRPIVLSICEWGTAKPWLWGKGSRRKSVAHHRRHSGSLGGQERMGAGQLLHLWRARHPRLQKMELTLTPGRATGTILTCSKSATAA